MISCNVSRRKMTNNSLFGGWEFSIYWDVDMKEKERSKKQDFLISNHLITSKSVGCSALTPKRWIMEKQKRHHIFLVKWAHGMHFGRWLATFSCLHLITKCHWMRDLTFDHAIPDTIWLGRVSEDILQDAILIAYRNNSFGFVFFFSFLQMKAQF